MKYKPLIMKIRIIMAKQTESNVKQCRTSSTNLSQTNL
jgi:hypothetical protein